MTTLGILALLNLLSAAWEAAPYGAWMVHGNPQGLYIDRDPSQRPQLKPGASLEGLEFKISINSSGFRGPDLANPRPDNAFRVWCIGGSTTFDILAPDNDATWPAQLQAALQQALPERTVEVINAGIPGEILWGSTQDFVAFQDQVQPDLLVIHSGPNDLRKARDMDDPPPPSLMHLIPDFALVRTLAVRLDPFKTGESSQSFQFDQRHLDQIYQEMRPILEEADSHGVKILMAGHALRLSQDPTEEELQEELGGLARLLRVSPRESARAFDLYNAMLKRVARERGYGFVNLRASIPAGHEYWGDETHFAAPGSALAGRVIADAILEGELTGDR
jgi:lysophospholipase L1-like esterase